MADKFQRIADAVIFLQEAIKDLGPDAELSEIILSGGLPTACRFTAAATNSPMFRNYDYTHTAHRSPQIRRVMGVDIRIRDDLGQEIY